MPMAALNEQQRTQILSAVSKTVQRRFYDPHFRGIDWSAAVEKHRSSILGAASVEGFEQAIAALLSELKSSHIGFYHRSLPRATSKAAINATYASFSINGLDQWVFQDVHEGGPAYAAGLRPGDVLQSVHGQPFRPPEHPIFLVGKQVEVGVLSAGSREKKCVIQIPPIADKLSRLPLVRRRNELAYARPTLVLRKRMEPDIGYIRVSMYPGMIGIEVANEFTSAVRALHPIRRLILDLRGNTGGGLAVLRLMSLLTPKRLPVGYYQGRRQSPDSESPQRFLMLDRIPEKKRGLFLLALKFEILPQILKLAGQKRSVMLGTQGLGPQPFHGRVVVLMNRHTASANEMLVAFVKANRLATLVGEATPGRLLAGSGFQLPYGYRLALPVGVYHTAAGAVLEGNPIAPDIEVPFDPGQAVEGKDTQLEAAIDTVMRL